MTENESKYGKVVIVGGRAAGRTMQAQVELLARIDELEAYRAIGTIDEFKALKEENETLKAFYEDARKEWNNLTVKTREEAITEFAEKLRPRLNTLVDRLRLDEIAGKLKGGAE